MKHLPWLLASLAPLGCAGTPNAAPPPQASPIVAIDTSATAEEAEDAPVSADEAEDAPAAEDDAAAAEELQDGRGNMWGDSIGEAFGAGGLGLKGAGLGAGGGGGLGSVGGLSHGLGASSTPPKVGAGVTPMGHLSKDDIRRVIRAHIDEVRHCYERGLQSAGPRLAGKIVVRFVIGIDGTVTTRQITDGLDASVDACVLSVFSRMKFPKPQGGGIVVVTYPFVFQPAADSSAQVP